ncbi:DUF2303 family protein [Pseudomonas syringae]|uniref:DUF2303 family protein n=1 Tax=Pseudomonas syringae TaxID=317 RepID=UPI001F43F696|nr:DUF2303 family protein [Pseudomonas syringae]
MALLATVTVVSLEKFQQTRNRFRGALETSSLKDFSEYVQAQADGSTSGFVDSNDMTCTVFFNQRASIDDPTEHLFLRQYTRLSQPYRQALIGI